MEMQSETLARALTYERSGLWQKAQEQFARAHDEAATRGDVSLELEADLGLARLHGQRGRRADAIDMAERVFARAEGAKLGDVAAQAKNIIGAAHEFAGDWSAATSTFRSALAIDGVSPRTRGKLYQNLGAVAALQKDFGQARKWFQESVEAWRSIGYGVGLALAITNLAAATLDTDDPERAAELALEGMDMARQEGALDVLAVALENRADALFRLHRTADALDTLAEALGLNSGARNGLRMAQCLELFGCMYRDSETGTAENAWRKAIGIAEEAGAGWLADRIRGRLSEIA
jgi:tetratricopeptide (TPR) repeat protein